MRKKCPKCGSNNVVLSRRRNTEWLLRYLLPIAYHRCKECRARFLRLGSPLAIPFITIMACLVVMFFLLPYVMSPIQKASREENQIVKNRVIRKPVVGMKVNAVSGEEHEKEINKNDQESKPVLPVKSEVAHEPRVLELPKGSDGEEAKIKNDIIKAALPEPPFTTEKKLVEETEEIPQYIAPSATATENRKPPTFMVNEKDELNLIGINSQTSEKEFKMMLLADRPIKQFKSFIIGAPPRLVIDLAGKWKKIPRSSEVKLKNDKVKRIRFGKHPDKLRVVLDLTGQSPISPVIKPSPDGLVLTIR